MNRDLSREIIGCLRVAGSGEEQRRRLREFSRRDWESSLNWMNLSGIALAFYDRLQEFETEGAVPPRVRMALAESFANHTVRIAAMRQEFNSLNAQFESAGIEYAVWKGFSLIPEYCRDACLRPIYDYDYLISENDLDQAQGILQGIGYVHRPDRGAQHSVNFARPPSRTPSSASQSLYFSAALPRKVELHRRLWDEDAFGISLRVPESPLDRKSKRCWQDASFYALEEEDEFLFQILHTFQHILHNWCRLGWLWEIAYFMEHRCTDASLWKKVCQHLEGNEPLTDVVALVILLTSQLFHATVPEELKPFILRPTQGRIGLWVDLYGLDSALDNFSEDKYPLFLYREFVRDQAAWRRLRNNRLVPLHPPNRVAGTASFATSALLPTSWKQGWYVVQRLIHHCVYGAGYLWESVRWDRLSRASAGRALP